jgi:hypothetical protein
MCSREDRWKASKEVNQKMLPPEHTEGDVEGGREISLFRCSWGWCQEKKYLRETPSGIWCERHYLRTESCSLCDEPRIDLGDGTLCRNHYFVEDEEATGIRRRELLRVRNYRTPYETGGGPWR